MRGGPPAASNNALIYLNNLIQYLMQYLMQYLIYSIYFCLNTLNTLYTFACTWPVP